MIIKNPNEKEILIDAIGKIIDSRIIFGRIQYKLKLNGQFIWLDSDNVKTLPTEEELK